MDVEVPVPIQKAVNETLHAALVFCRNYVLRKDADTRCVYELMEAIHEIPQSMNIWAKYHHDLATLRIHLMCFDHTRWPGVQAPNMIGIFNDALEQFTKQQD